MIQKIVKNLLIVRLVTRFKNSPFFPLGELCLQHTYKTFSRK
ncbi:hypothetical protein NEOC65_001247 [Neochlamydia sp. AcF65]|nr:hypothetical protein [Neochlamydia sp. AcF65]